jgi:two-component system chemotaxis response regulator CheY
MGGRTDVIVWSGQQRGESPGARAGSVASADRRSGTPAPILVVDDDPSILETVRAILESEGYAVVTATNGREALEVLESVTPFLMLLDMRMPVLDGWGVAAALRGSAHRFPVIVMTAAENARRWADEIRADDHIAKPFDLNDLIQCVQRHERRQRRN